MIILYLRLIIGKKEKSHFDDWKKSIQIRVNRILKKQKFFFFLDEKIRKKHIILML